MCLVGSHKKRSLVFFSRCFFFWFPWMTCEWQRGFALGHNTETWSALHRNPNEGNKYEFLAFRDHFNVSLSISFSFCHYVSPFFFCLSSSVHEFFFNTTPFNCYYQIQLRACNTRKLWNYFRTKIVCSYFDRIRFIDRICFHWIWFFWFGEKCNVFDTIYVQRNVKTIEKKK